MRHHEHDDQPYIVIEKHSNDISNLLLGVLIGAGVALLFAPRSGPETRKEIGRRARQATDKVKNVAEEVKGQVVDTYEGARARVEEQIESARYAIETKKRQVSRAMEAGREAATDARAELEARLAETKAAYNAGGEVARGSRKRTPPVVPDDVTV
jgi:gas vesicle protein